MRTRSLGILVLALTLVFAACGDSGEPAAPAPAEAAPTTAPVPEPTDTTTPTTTAAPPPTSAPTSSTTTPPPEPQPADAPIGYRVVGVAADDVLNVRAGPSAGDTIVGTLAPDASGVVVTDTYRHEPWWEVVLDDGTVGWAHSRYLQLDERWSAPFGELACAGVAMDAGPQRSPAAASNADFVDGFEFLTSPSCDRLVVRLGTRTTFDERPPDFPSMAADRVPGGIEVATAGNRVLVTLPLEVAWGEETAEYGDALLLVGYAEGAEDFTTFTAHLVYASERVAHARFLDDPARIVVDVVPAPDPSGVDLSPVAQGDAVLTEPAGWDGTLPGTRQPLTVTGFGRAFESTLFISLERVDGGPVDATWSGGYDCGEDPGRSYCTMSSGSSVWGSFAITIDDLDPGDYVLTMAGECMVDEVGEEACAAAELRHPFTVHGHAGTAADALAPFFAAADRLDHEIAAAAAAFNSGYDADAGTVSLAAQDAIRALRTSGVAAAIPPGMSADLERAVLAVYADLDSRIAALDGAIRYIPEGSTLLSMPEDVLPCLANGSGSKARFAADLATARSLAAREAAPTAGPDSVAAGVLAVRIDVIGLWNSGCDSCGGATYDETLPVDWEARLIEDRVSFEAEFSDGVWRVLVNAC